MISSRRATVYTRVFLVAAFTRRPTLSLPFLRKRFCRATAEHASGVRPRDEWPGFLHKGRARPGGAGRCNTRTSVSELIPTAALTFRRAWEKSGRPIISRLGDDNRRSRSKFASHVAVVHPRRRAGPGRFRADYLTNFIKASDFLHLPHLYLHSRCDPLYDVRR